MKVLLLQETWEGGEGRGGDGRGRQSRHVLRNNVSQHSIGSSPNNGT